ncbi:L-rhamnose-binding lectin CSL3-like [Argopecten irradians]|uniref:L-rhamnose-binding lectin CSL3-like n=1 Tax=Argopecten irradians TaxID=31199 RepID=UPI00371FAEC5
MKTCLVFLTLAVVSVVHSVPPIRKTIACENRTAYLRCRPGYTIEIVTVKYGRSDYDTCPCSSITIRTTHCSSRQSFDVVRSSCDGLRSCEVRASNNVFGDPCRGTYKYLSIRYMCKKDIETADIRHSITCENRKTTLSCRSGEVLDIVSANYGRSELDICYSKIIKTTHCSSSKSFYKVYDQCQGLRKCRLSASNNVYGDPCRGTVKYLDVEYRCVLY